MKANHIQSRTDNRFYRQNRPIPFIIQSNHRKQEDHTHYFISFPSNRTIMATYTPTDSNMYDRCGLPWSQSVKPEEDTVADADQGLYKNVRQLMRSPAYATGGIRVQCEGTAENPYTDLPIDIIKYRMNYPMNDNFNFIRAHPDLEVKFGFDANDSNISVCHVIKRDSGKYPSTYDTVFVRLTVKQLQFIQRLEAHFIAQMTPILARMGINKPFKSLMDNQFFGLKLKPSFNRREGHIQTRVMDATSNGLKGDMNCPVLPFNDVMKEGTVLGFSALFTSGYINEYGYGLTLKPTEIWIMTF